GGCGGRGDASRSPGGRPPRDGRGHGVAGHRPGGRQAGVSGADLVVTGAPVYTAGRDGRPADTVAIRHGRIAAVGTLTDVEGLIGPATRMIRFGGGMVVPGFQDSHLHPDGGGIDMRRCALYDLHGRQDYEEAMRSYAADHPEVPWILGGGWTLDDFPRGCPHRSI